LLWSALLSCLAFSLSTRPRNLSFLALPEQPVASRRRIALAIGAGLLSEPAWAEEAAPKPKKERPPESLLSDGFPSKAVPVNGRWSIVFGKKIAGKPVYKKDGEQLFLMTNDCGQLQIDETKKATCDGSVGIEKESGWVINGQKAPDFTVRPETKEDMKKVTLMSQGQLDKIVNQELARFEEKSAVSTFRGTMEDEEEAVGDRLLKKMGAKIMDGM